MQIRVLQAPDERPIRGTQKTFEELLEEKLSNPTEQERNNEENVGNNSVVTSTLSQHQPEFLGYCFDITKYVDIM